MAKKKYQIININNNNNFIIQFGVVDRLNPEIVFVKCKTYLSSDVIDDHNYNIKIIFNKIKKRLQDAIRDSFFDNEFIFDYDVTQDLITSFKNKILTFDIFIKQSNNISKLPFLKNTLSDLTIPLLDILENHLPTYNIFLSKTKQK